MFTWGSLAFYLRTYLPGVCLLVSIAALSFLAGKVPERLKWKAYLRTYSKEISRDYVASLKADLTRLQAHHLTLKENFNFQQAVLKAAHLQASKVLEILASIRSTP
jgi:hypothetical protein